MKSNPSDEPTQEHAAKNGTSPPPRRFGTKHEDPVQAWIQNAAQWDPETVFEFLEAAPQGDKGFWLKDSTMALCARLRHDLAQWQAVKHLASASAKVYPPDLEAYLDEWCARHMIDGAASVHCVTGASRTQPRRASDAQLPSLLPRPDNCQGTSCHPLSVGG